MEPQMEKPVYYVYGIWNGERSAFVTKDKRPDIITFDNLQDALDELSVRADENVNIMWCICKSEPKIDTDDTQIFRLK